MGTISGFGPVHRLTEGTLFIDGPVFLPVLGIGGFPPVAQLPLHIFGVVHVVVHRVEDGDKAAVIALIHPDHIDQGNAHVLAVGVQHILRARILLRLPSGQIEIQAVAVHQLCGSTGYMEGGVGILLFKGFGKACVAQGAHDQGEHQQQDQNDPDDVHGKAGAHMFDLFHPSVSSPTPRFRRRK